MNQSKIASAGIKHLFTSHYQALAFFGLILSWL